MKHRYWLPLLASLAMVFFANNVGITQSSLIDLEDSTGNAFQGWTSTPWLQTDQADFDAGVLNNVDTSSSPGDVKLAVESNWYNTNWQYRRAITIDHTKVQDVVNPSATYANFPVLVYATGLSNIKANGADIRFTSSNGIAELPREIESYSGGTLYAWVKVTLTNDAGDSSNDIIYMYYGNSVATEPAPNSTYGSQNVWDSNYKGVWHLKDLTTSTVKDSTSNNKDGTKTGAGEPALTTNGKISDAQVFDGSNDKIVTLLADTLGDFTVEAWFRDTGVKTMYERIVDKSYTGGFWIGRNSTTANSWGGGVRETTSPLGRFVTLTDGQWHQIVSKRAGTTHYIIGDGGAVSTTGTVTNAALDSTVVRIGVDAAGSSFAYFSGVIDEVRISNIARSADWIRTCYNNQNSPSTFCNLGGEVGLYVSSGTIASQVLDCGISGTRWDAIFWNRTLPAGTGITLEVRAGDVSFAKDGPSPSWISIGGISPVTSGLPSGRYEQWRATLTTADTSLTPVLHEVLVYHN